MSEEKDMASGRAVVGFEGLYTVNSTGIVYSIRSGRPLNWWINSSGYPMVKLTNGDRGKQYRVHRLVCEAFHGPQPRNKPDVAHQDGDRMNPSADNVRWASRKDNALDRIAHGTDHRGEKCPTAKLTSSDVVEIRRRAKLGEKPKVIARDYPVGRSHVANIIRGSRDLWRTENV